MSEDWKMEYDGRQHQLMTTQLQQYEEGKLGLALLIANLKALLGALESPDESWRDSFRSEWGTLEAVYAMALFRKEQSLVPDVQTTINDPSNRALIDEAIRNMRRLLEMVEKSTGEGHG